MWKKIEVELCTIFFDADNKKVLHVNPKVIDEIISDFKVYFGDLVITRGKKHSFLSMNIEITK